MSRLFAATRRQLSPSLAEQLNLPRVPAPLPLGAIAAGFGLVLGQSLSAPALAQATAGASEEALPETTLRKVIVTGTVPRTAKDQLRTTTTTLGKGRQEIRDIPQSLTVVTEKLLDDAKLDTLRQALHYTAGITFAATENGTDQDIRMRGFPIASTGDLLIDGMKDPSQYDRDSFNLDRIEVLRGSASMLFGRGSTGGVVNQVNKQPMLINSHELVTTVGTGGYTRLTGDFNLRLGESAAVRLNLMNTAADGHGASIDKQGIAPTLRWGIGERNEFSVGLFHLQSRNVPMSNLRYLGGSVADGIPARNFYGTDSDYVRGDATYAMASWTHRFDGGAEWRTQLRSGRFLRASWGTTVAYCGLALTAAGACPANTPAVTAGTLGAATALTRTGLSPRQDDIEGRYLQSDVSHRLQLGGLTHRLQAGIDAAYERADRFGAAGAVGTNYNKGGTSVGTPNDGRITPAVPIFRKTSDYAGTALGAYAQDLVELAPQWKLLAGLRYDRFEANMGQITYNAAGAVATMPTSRLRYPSLWSHRVGVLFQPTPSQSYHLSHGSSFNTSADTYQYTTQQIANVGAEKSRNVELGAKLDWLGGELSTRFAIFRTEKYNERTTDADFAGTTPVLSGQRHTQGIEVDVVGRLTPKLETYLSYAYIDQAKIDKVGTAATGAGSPVGLTPRHTGAVWVGYQLLPALRIAAGARGASTNRPLQGTNGAASTTAKAPGYVAYDAMVEYTFSRHVYAQFNLSNLSDKVYGDQLYPGFYTPGEPRSAKLTLGLKF